jgi:hypothetical protein
MEYSVKARDAVSLRVIKGLQDIYKNKVRGVEDASSFAFFEVCVPCTMHWQGSLVHLARKNGCCTPDLKRADKCNVFSPLRQLSF